MSQKCPQPDSEPTGLHFPYCGLFFAQNPMLHSPKWHLGIELALSVRGLRIGH